MFLHTRLGQIDLLVVLNLRGKVVDPGLQLLKWDFGNHLSF